MEKQAGKVEEYYMQRINEDINNGKFRQMYLLYGEERYLKRQYREKLKKALCTDGDQMNVQVYEGKDQNIGEIIDLAETLPFLAERRVIFLDNSGLFKAGGEKLAEYLEHPNETTFFVFTENEIDKRSKLYKTVNSGGIAVEFGIQDEAVLKRWVAGMLKKEGKRITEANAGLFLMKTGTDMDNIHTELEKLICYCMDKDVVEATDVETICTVRVTNHIFDMLNCLAEGRTRQALSLYYDLVALKEPPMRILFLIARQCNVLLQVKEMKARGMDNKTMGSKVGLPPFVVGKYVSQAARFKSSILKKAVVKCVEAEEAVKTGKMSDSLSLEVLILSVFEHKQQA